MPGPYSAPFSTFSRLLALTSQPWGHVAVGSLTSSGAAAMAAGALAIPGPGWSVAGAIALGAGIGLGIYKFTQPPRAHLVVNVAPLDVVLQPEDGPMVQLDPLPW